MDDFNELEEEGLTGDDGVPKLDGEEDDDDDDLADDDT